MDAVSYSLASKQAQRIEKFIENPDSDSGVLTQPKVIEAGETVTIKSGRQAILADTVVDGDLVIEAGADVFVPAGAGFNDLESQIALKADTSYVNDKYSGFKNYIINGNFDIWQRGNSQTTSGYASADRWNFYNAGTSSRTVEQTITTDADRPYFNTSKILCTTLTTLDSTTSGRGIRHIQPIEDVTKLAGKTVTYSFWARSTNNMDIEVTNQQVFGTGGAPSSTIVVNARRFSLTPQWTKFTETVSIPSTIGKTLGTNGVNTSCTNFKFHLMADSVTAASEGLTGTLTPTAGTLVFFAQVQLEEGSVATPFENRPYGLELSLCQRYYTSKIRFGLYNNAPDTRIIGGSVTFNTPMRITPTMGLVVGVAVTYQNTTLHGTEYHSTVGAGGWNQGDHYASAEL